MVWIKYFLKKMIYKKHIFVCTNLRDKQKNRECCSAKNSDLIRLELVKLIKKNKLNTTIRSNKSGCLNLCEFGPVLVIYPIGIWYIKVEIKDVKEIFEKSILNNNIIDRLIPKSNILREVNRLRSN